MLLPKMHVFVFFLMSMEYVSGHGVSSEHLQCPDVASDDGRSQERIINALSGRKIVFIGDSVTRCDSVEYFNV